MAEPDEALLWVRDAAWRFWAETDPEYCRQVQAGDWDYDPGVWGRAEAYRAGAAASEARIKELEEALRPLAHATLRHPEVLGLTTENVMTARALLKETDQ